MVRRRGAVPLLNSRDTVLACTWVRPAISAAGTPRLLRTIRRSWANAGVSKYFMTTSNPPESYLTYCAVDKALRP